MKTRAAFPVPALGCAGPAPRTPTTVGVLDIGSGGGETVAWRACGIATGPAASPCHDANRAKFEKTPAATCLPNSRTCLADAIVALLPDGTGGDGTLSDTVSAGDGSPACASNSRCQPAHESSRPGGASARAHQEQRGRADGGDRSSEARSLARGHAQGDGGG